MAKYINTDITSIVIDNQEIEVKDGICNLTDEQFQQVKHCGFKLFIENNEKPKRTTKAK